ncbi:DinB family protein [Psychroflexus sp. YR1-1]|uniref:DinB family protein n=1 Tax=Psychroflexus aurantiacus TaxID=2709310 RepID=A0A6B3QYX8_9FLAO|nr:DinB family protein [Psychroflexus aurantiacus]NEV93416.1 DinB family protein [Psychroflexus aurantiacus]
MRNTTPDYWLRGSVEEVPPLLQPAAHALLQSQLEAHRYTEGFKETMLWDTVFGRASLGFHLQHISGVIDRVLTYAQHKPPSKSQFIYLKNEGKANDETTLALLLSNLDAKIEESLLYYKTLKDTDLTQYRPVGRKHLPFTLIVVLFHAAEHSQRHIGQLLVTVSSLEN